MMVHQDTLTFRYAVHLVHGVPLMACNNIIFWSYCLKL